MNKFIEITEIMNRLIASTKLDLIKSWVLLNQSLEVLPEVRHGLEEDAENE